MYKGSAELIGNTLAFDFRECGSNPGRGEKTYLFRAGTLLYFVVLCCAKYKTGSFGLNIHHV